MEFSQLHKIAADLVNYRTLDDFGSAGAVACALVTDKGNVYKGVNIDLCCGIGFCAEHSAIAAMITAGETRIEKIIAAGSDGGILPPCGRCRELIGQVDKANMHTKVMVGENKIFPLYELMPFDWKNTVSQEQLESR